MITYWSLFFSFTFRKLSIKTNMQNNFNQLRVGASDYTSYTNVITINSSNKTIAWYRTSRVRGVYTLITTRSTSKPNKSIFDLLLSLEKENLDLDGKKSIVLLDGAI